MRTVFAKLLICFGLLFVTAGTASGHVVVANSATADIGFIGPRIGNSGYITAEEFAQASFLRYQGFVNEGYDRALLAESKGLLNGKNPNTRVGDFVDRFSASEYRDWLAAEGIPEGPGQFVQMNRWLRDPSGSGLYARPDIRIPSSGSILDATVGWKWSTDTQIMRFDTYSGGNRITIVRPEQIGGSYSIWP